jgi:hypothetical protein
VTIGRNVPLHRGRMREKVVLICPTWQAPTPATDWHDGQFAHGAHAEIARRASDPVHYLSQLDQGRLWPAGGWHTGLPQLRKYPCVPALTLRANRRHLDAMQSPRQLARS